MFIFKMYYCHISKVINSSLVFHTISLIPFAGMTYWNTWISFKGNISNGRCHEVDPYTGYLSLTKVVPQGKVAFISLLWGTVIYLAPLTHKHVHVSFLPQGGNYERSVYDNEDPIPMRFLITEDGTKGCITNSSM